METKIKEYLIEKIKNMPCSTNFKTVSVRYYIKNSTGLHILIVSPASLLECSDEFCDWENDLYDEFFERFPNQDVLVTDYYDLQRGCNKIYETCRNCIYESVHKEKELLMQ